MLFSYSEYYQTFQDINLDFTGNEALVKGKAFGPSVRENFVIHYITAGQGYFEINNRRIALKAGDIFVLPAEIETYYQADFKNPWSYIWIGISGNTLVEFFYRTQLSENNWVLHNVRHSQFLTYFMQLQKLISNDSSTKDIELQINLFSMFKSLIREYPRLTPNRQNQAEQYAEAAHRFITTNYIKKIKIKDVLDHVALSRSYLFTIFKNKYGISPQHYLLNLRMNQAISLLLNSDYSMQMISNAIGFSDSLAFSSAFKKRYSISPTKFRAENQKNLLIETKTSINRIKKDVHDKNREHLKK
ncbi:MULTISPECIES: AraC family ligand binding domain-containing protein [unclassified Enterococcus]|uniref:AraC family transcriptional regulator n=1 Tax=unclassified Enterococcus TaxID=2608891 RepID=UPI001557FF1B|nr:MULTISPECIES: AraC family ligand binding domain-containing protein [unclassified Enterococcus]MBS7578052.1 AraC family ligand binding domain-containing protein [Enterococcus sp. MMGLQ5-2]MBS7585258.1 AraC family ligand binding domain-containing protein [Enterococcus sp. MMGLQ5-1]NPD13115.1 helix-turn-helix domain-containing protein [Enterococcus sp. MMGLQ5-1]NPD37883.1 helix-turn-helix domain-containing protein [Enterococcus sp. MMGLQ5-2]